MTLNEYQEKALATAIYPNRGGNLVYPALKLAGEAGEVAEKVGKLMRDHGYRPGVQYEITPEKCQELVKELGDVMWYVAAIADELEVSLNEIAATNIAKLLDRQKRGVLQGSGDKR